LPRSGEGEQKSNRTRSVFNALPRWRHISQERKESFQRPNDGIRNLEGRYGITFSRSSGNATVRRIQQNADGDSKNPLSKQVSKDITSCQTRNEEVTVTSRKLTGKMNAITYFNP
jgi:hypothetical protein